MWSPSQREIVTLLVVNNHHRMKQHAEFTADWQRYTFLSHKNQKPNEARLQAHLFSFGQILENKKKYEP